MRKLALLASLSFRVPRTQECVEQARKEKLAGDELYKSVEACLRPVD